MSKVTPQITTVSEPVSMNAEPTPGVHPRPSNEAPLSEKKQPWKEFLKRDLVSAQPVYNADGGGSIRLRAELDDKDLGG